MTSIQPLGRRSVAQHATECRTRCHSRRGLTLLEIVVALALSAIVISLLSAAIFGFLSQLERRRDQVAGAQLARAIMDTIRRDLQPVIQKIDRVADEAGRITALAAIQVERVDELLSATVARMDSAMTIVQDAFVQPLRRGSAILTAVRAGWAIFRGWQGRQPRYRRDDEDALFVG